MSIPTAPSHEMSIKEALVFAGKLDKSKAGKGKPSRQMRADAETLVTQHNYRIKGMSVSKPSTPDEAPQVKKVPTSGKEIADIGPPLRDPAEWEAFTYVDGKAVVLPIGIKGVCQAGCGGSFTYCPCPKPLTWVDYDRLDVVHFRQRRS